jgi:hypothetical protein
MAAKPFSRKGLHRLECPACPGYAYSTVACLETVGQPSCPCGETLQPTELELAFILGAEDSRPMVEYLRKCNSVAKGQAGPGSAHLADTSHYESPEEQAAKFVEKSRRQSARARRLAALLPAPQPMPF